MLFSKMLSFYFQAQSRKHLAAPFIKHFQQEVVDDDRYYYSFDAWRSLKAKLLQQEDSIEVLDLGAGSRKVGGAKRKIKDIAKNAVSPNWQCQQLYYMIREFTPKTILEVGTSLGLSSLYMQAAAPHAQFITLEGSPAVARLARQHFEAAKASQVKLIEGNFDQSLSTALTELSSLDFAFIDGNHQKTATLNYFEACLPYIHEGSVLVFDDIYWSKEMFSAWQELKNRSAVAFSIDLCWAGLLFFKQLDHHKKDWKLISKSYRPW